MNRIANHEVPYMFRISFTSADSILKDILYMCHFAMKSMPHLQNDKQTRFMADSSIPSLQTHFFHFSELKIALKRRRLDNTTMIKINHGTQSNNAPHEVI